MNLLSLLGICRHKWIEREIVSVFDEGSDKYPKRYEIVLKCEHCGDIKVKRV
jgi:hypothetical protein